MEIIGGSLEWPFNKLIGGMFEKVPVLSFCYHSNKSIFVTGIVYYLIICDCFRSLLMPLVSCLINVAMLGLWHRTTAYECNIFMCKQNLLNCVNLNVCIYVLQGVDLCLSHFVFHITVLIDFVIFINKGLVIFDHNAIIYCKIFNAIFCTCESMFDLLHSKIMI